MGKGNAAQSRSWEIELPLLVRVTAFLDFLPPRCEEKALDCVWDIKEGVSRNSKLMRFKE